MTATVIIAAFAVICLLASNVVSSLTFRQALRDMSRDRQRDSERRDAQLSALLDRFQAIKWEDLAAMRSIQDTTEEGGFLSPAEQREEAAVELDEQIRWGPMSRLRQAQEMDEMEQALLAEDFPDALEAQEKT